MSSIYELLPDHELLLNLEPEELAGVVLEYLHSLPDESRNRDYLFNSVSNSPTGGYPPGEQENIKRALAEAWAWLATQGLIAPLPEKNESGKFLFFITRRGLRLQNVEALEAYRQANLLPRQLLPPAIAEDIWLLFSRGRYDAAVLQAFKAVEVAVRGASGYTEYYGTDLMRQAFHDERGPLTDASQPEAERQATSHLFAAAIGLYKNPHSHRNVPVTAEEAVELIIFASHLLRIVDSRAQTSADL